MLDSFKKLWGFSKTTGRDERPACPCRKCHLTICYSPEKAGKLILCPRCRASVRLPEQPPFVRYETDSAICYEAP